MGGACATVLEAGESFLTADLRVEFMRAGRPGLLRSEGRVVRRTKRVVFCAAELYDADGDHIASAPLHPGDQNRPIDQVTVCYLR